MANLKLLNHEAGKSLQKASTNASWLITGRASFGIA